MIIGPGSSTGRSRKVMRPRRHLTLIDLIAAVVAAALGMGLLMWDPPPPSLPAPVVIFWLTVPLVGILWDRWRGAGAYSAGPWAGRLRRPSR